MLACLLAGCYKFFPLFLLSHHYSTFSTRSVHASAERERREGEIIDRMARVVRGTSSFQISTDRNHSGKYYICFSLKLFVLIIIPIFETCSKSYYNCGSSIFIIPLVALHSSLILYIDLNISIYFIYHSITIVLHYSTFHLTYYWVHSPKIITDIDHFFSLFSSLLYIILHILARASYKAPKRCSRGRERGRGKGSTLSLPLSLPRLRLFGAL